MSRLLTAPLALLTMLALACGTGDGESDSQGGSGLPSPGTAPVGGVISAGNASLLQQVARDEPASIQILKEGNIRGVRWQHDSARALLHTRTGVYELKNHDGAPTATLFKVELGERILDLWPTGGEDGSGFYVTLTDSITYNLRDLAGSGITTLTTDGPINSAVVVGNGSQVALSRFDRLVVNLVSVAEGNEAKELSGFQASPPIFSVSGTPDGKSLVWLSRATAQMMDIASGSMGPRITHEASVDVLAASHDSVLLATGIGPLVTLWEAASGSKRSSLSHKGDVVGLDFSPDGQLLAVATTQGVSLWELSSGRQLATLPGDYRFAAFSPDMRVLLTVENKGIATLWRP